MSRRISIPERHNMYSTLNIYLILQHMVALRSRIREHESSNNMHTNRIHQIPSICCLCFLLKNENLSRCKRRPIHSGRMALRIILKPKVPTKDLHDVENGNNCIFLIVLLTIMIHGAWIVSRYFVGFKCQAICISGIMNRRQLLIDRLN